MQIHDNVPAEIDLLMHIFTRIETREDVPSNLGTLLSKTRFVPHNVFPSWVHRFDQRDIFYVPWGYIFRALEPYLMDAFRYHCNSIT